jgi:hypothetical protein
MGGYSKVPPPIPQLSSVEGKPLERAILCAKERKLILFRRPLKSENNTKRPPDIQPDCDKGNRIVKEGTA